MKYLLLTIFLSGCASTKVEHTNVCYLQTVRDWCMPGYYIAGYRENYELGMHQEVCCEGNR